MRAAMFEKALARYGAEVSVFLLDRDQKMTRKGSVRAFIQPVEGRASEITPRIGPRDDAVFTYIGPAGTELPGAGEGVIEVLGGLFKMTRSEVQYFGGEAVYRYARLERWRGDE